MLQELLAKIVKVVGQDVTVHFDDEIDVMKLTRYMVEGQRPTVGMLISDQRSFSVEQRRKWWALLDDFAEYTGYVNPKKQDLDEAAFVIKSEYVRETGAEWFSWADKSPMTMSEANRVLDFLIEFMIEHDIPFAMKTWDSIKDDYAVQMLALKKRICVICGSEHAQVAHFNPVGMGRNRRKVIASEFWYMSLCSKHHMEQHTIGMDTFMSKYIVKPVKLTDQQIKEFGIIGRVRKQQEEAG